MVFLLAFVFFYVLFFFFSLSFSLLSFFFIVFCFSFYCLSIFIYLVLFFPFFSSPFFLSHLLLLSTSFSLKTRSLHAFFLLLRPATWGVRPLPPLSSPPHFLVLSPSPHLHSPRRLTHTSGNDPFSITSMIKCEII